MQYKFSSLICVYFVCLAMIIGCGKKDASIQFERKIPIIGFAQAIEDETINDARKGFIEALAKNGFSDSAKTVEVLYKNAQGDQVALNQILDQFVGMKVNVIATNTTLAMIDAVSKTKAIPVFMMVGPSPTINNLTETDSTGRNIKSPRNLSGVYETLTYIDSNLVLIKTMFPKARRIGTIYNNSETNSTNAIKRLRAIARQMGFEVEERAITSSNETQQAAQSLAEKKIDVFFALPDNLLFASFETVVKTMNDKKIPITTSEAGLVKRGAVCGYGADFYQWGYQVGEQVASFLKDPPDSTGSSLQKLGYPLQTVRVRRSVYNSEALKLFGLTPPQNSTQVK
jgi:putative tryptophan/tyrosine transport system substrate-binding protein